MSEQLKSRMLTRRDLLKLAGVASAGLLANACVTTVPAQPQVSEKVVPAEAAVEDTGCADDGAN